MMLVDWVLYENGWFIDSYNNSQLYRYVCQLSYARPDALEYIKNNITIRYCEIETF